MNVRNYDDLRKALDTIRNQPVVNPDSVNQVFESAAEGGLKLSQEEAQAVMAEYGYLFEGRQVDRARAFIDATSPLLVEKPDGEGASMMDIMASSNATIKKAAAGGQLNRRGRARAEGPYTKETFFANLKGRIDYITFSNELKAAKKANIELSPAEFAQLYRDAGQRVINSDSYFVEKAIGLLVEPGKGDAASTDELLSIYADDEGLLTTDAIERAISDFTRAFTKRGAAEPQAKALSALLGQQGLPDLTAVKKVKGIEISTVRGYAVHSENYRNKVLDTLFKSTRFLILEHLKDGASNKIKHAHNFKELAKALAHTKDLDKVMAHVAQHTGTAFMDHVYHDVAIEDRPPAITDVMQKNGKQFTQAFTSMKGQQAADICAMLTQLDDIRVLVMDSDKTENISPADSVLVQIGQTTEVHEVGEVLTGKLRVQACSQQAIRDFTDENGGCRLQFTPSKFFGPDDFFEIETHGLRQKWIRERVEVAPGQFKMVRHPISGTDAVTHLKDEATQYGVDCAASVSAVWSYEKNLEYKNIHGEELGKAKFDKEFDHLLVGMWDAHWENALRKTTVPVDPVLDVADAGTSRYYRTHDVDPKGQLVGFQGENVLVYGRSPNGQLILWGNPFGFTTEEDVVRELKTFQRGIKIEGDDWKEIRTASDAFHAYTEAPENQRYFVRQRNEKIDKRLQGIASLVEKSVGLRAEQEKVMAETKGEYGRRYSAMEAAEREMKGTKRSSPEFEAVHATYMEAYESFKEISDKITTANSAVSTVDREIASRSTPFIKAMESELSKMTNKESPRGILYKDILLSMDSIQPMPPSLEKIGRRLLPEPEAR